MNPILKDELELYVNVFNRKKGYKQEYEQNLYSAAKLNDTLFSQCGYNSGNFTSHGPDHSARMLRFAVHICKTNNRLSAHDYYVLGLAIILHDLGMTSPIPEKYVKCSEEQKWHYRRERHANEIRSVLQQKQTELGAIKAADPHLYEIFLPVLCKSHATANFKPCVEQLRKNKSLDRNTKYPYLAGVLMFCDELDISRHRAPANFPFRNEFSNKTKLHWYKHFVIEDCSITKNVINIVHVSDQSINHAGLFTEWVVRKIEIQRQLIVDTIDPTEDTFFAEAVINRKSVHDTTLKIPSVDRNVYAHLKTELYNLGANNEILSPHQLRETIKDFDSQEPPLAFYNEFIQPYLPLFRGKGELETPESVLKTYVLVEENKKILAMLDNDVKSLIINRINLQEDPISGNPYREYPTDRIKQVRNLRLLTGMIGTGKTHLLNFFWHTFIKNHPEIYKQAIFLKCECTNESSLIEIKRNIVKSLYAELGKRLGVLDSFRNYYRQMEAKVHIPALYSSGMTETEIDHLLEITGDTIREYNSSIIFNTGTPPRAIFLFLDNSDQIELSELSRVYDWCYKSCSDIFTYCVMFFRPNVYDQIFHNKQSTMDFTTSREPIVVKPATSQLILVQRINYLFSDDLKLAGKRIDLIFNQAKIGGQFTIENLQVALKNLCRNVTIKSSFMLPSFVGTNGRQLLELFIRILGSWKLSTEILFAYSSYSLHESTNEPDSEITRWFELLECLMLGNRAWYNSAVSPVTNLFNPPDIRFELDYFSAIHILQILAEIPGNRINIQELKEKMGVIGYSDYKVERVIRWMGFLPNEIDFPQMNKKAFSLVHLYDNEGYQILNDDYLNNHVSIEISNCGKYHLENIIYSHAFWKYAFYEIILPGGYLATTDKMKADDVVMSVLDYLEEKESCWFKRYYTDESMPVRKVVPDIKRFDKFLNDRK